MQPSRALGLAMALTLSAAAARGQTLPTFSAHALLDAHNSARERVGSPPLAWSPALASDAGNGPGNCWRRTISRTSRMTGTARTCS